VKNLLTHLAVVSQVQALGDLFDFVALRLARKNIQLSVIQHF